MRRFTAFVYTLVIATLISALTFAPFSFSATTGVQIDFLLSQVRNSSGSLAGGSVYFYSAGTTTSKDVYLDINKVAAAANPYTLDANGTALLYGDGTYRIVIKTSAGVTVYDRDNIKIEDLATDLINAEYVYTLKPKGLIGNDTGNITGYDNITATTRVRAPSIGSASYTDNGYFNYSDSNYSRFANGPWVDVTHPTYGAVGDATTSGGTDSSPGFQAAINAAPAGHVVLAVGSYRLNSSVNLKANIIYDFRGATFYGGTLTDQWVFRGNAIDNITVYGGRFLATASYTSTTTIPTGTYTDFVGFQFDNCYNINIYGGEYYGYWGAVNFYDTMHSSVQGIYTLNGNASIAVLAKTKDVTNIKILNNTIIGGGDDGIAMLSDTGAFNLLDSIVEGNYVDKTRLDGSVEAAVGIRAGTYSGGTGVVKTLMIKNNVLKDMVAHAIYTHNISDSSIEGNTINGWGKRLAAAISIGTTGNGGQRIKVLSNIVISPSADNAIGLSMIAMDNCYVDGNTFISNRTGVGGVYLNDSSRIVLSENHIENPLSVGIQEENSDYNVFMNNRLPVWDTNPYTALSTHSSAYGNRTDTNGDRLQGFAQLVSGEVTVSTAAILAADIMKTHVSRSYPSGNLGYLWIDSISAGTSFVIKSSSATDNSYVFWKIEH